MKKLYNIFFHFALPAIAFCCILFLLYFHFFIAEITHKRLIELCTNNHCSLQATITKSGILYPKIMMHDVTVTSDDTDWSWHASEIECSFSLLRLFMFWSIPVSVIIHSFQGDSIVRDPYTLAIFDFFNLFDNISNQFFQPYISVMYTQHAELQVKSIKPEIAMTLKFHSHATATQNSKFEATITIIDGQIKQIAQSQSLISSISGIFQYIQNKEDAKVSIQTKGMFTDTQESVYLKGTSENNSGRFSVSTNHQNCFLDPIIYTKHSSKLSGQISAPFIQKILHLQTEVEGIVTVQLLCDHTKKEELRGLLVLQDWRWDTTKLFSSAKITVFSKESTIFGPVSIKNALGDFSGNYSYDRHTEVGQCSIKNKLEGKSPIFPFISLHNDSFEFTCTLNKTYLTTHATCDIFDTLKHKTYKSSFDLMLSYKEGMQLRGSLDTLQLAGFMFWKKEYNGLLSLRDMQKEIASLQLRQNSDGNKDFSGYIQTNIIKTVTELCSAPIPFYGEGIVSFYGKKDNISLNTHYAFEGGAIDIPHIHNFLLSTNGIVSLNSREKKLSIKEITAVFSTGTLSCSDAEITYDKNWSIQSCSVPVKINKCAISPHNFFDSLISAQTDIRKDKNKTHFFISGNILMHNGFIKNDNPLKKFLDQQHSTLRSAFQIEHAINFETENPIRVETKQIKTDISVKLTSTGQLHSPRLQGSIICSNGEIQFPYKSLHITHGKILLSGGDFSDATIELFARNTVKNYRISMRASGSIVNHHIFFDATPSLSQSQISSLLLFGSLQENVSIFVPSLFSHTIKLGSFDINFVPGFSDKSSRGGIRGALEIGINNRLRATIQKNFTLSEDTRFELEYAITDMLSVRAVRDERRDLGGEFEFRLKF